jgi:hypothetical protein
MMQTNARGEHLARHGMSLQVCFVVRNDQEAAGESRGHNDGGIAYRVWNNVVRTYDIPIAVQEYMLRVKNRVKRDEICRFVRPSLCRNLFCP